MIRPLSIRQAVIDLPIPRKLTLILGLFSIVIFSLLALSYFGMEVLSSNRAYVGGESLWSKAQKQAVLGLGRYAWSHDEKEYQDYLAALEIPLGDRQARLELEKPNPNFDAATTGFLRGGNHPKDIPGMIHLFRRFRHVSYMNRAIDIWSQGDAYIAELQKVGEEIHRELTARRRSLIRLEKLLQESHDINSKLTPLENAFSSTLGEAARWLKGVLLAVMILATGAFLAITLGIAYLISRHLCDDIDQLRAGAARIARGDYSFSLNMESKDEIGDLARTFQQMATNVAAANQELEAFSYSVSHDLRAPLRAIDGFSRELVDSEERLNERGKADLGRIRAATQRMGLLIDDLLELSRLSRSELKREAVDLSAQVSGIVEKLKSSDPGRPVKWSIAPHLSAEGDPRLLQVALDNLIQNAWKFTQKQPQAKIEFGAMSQNGSRTFFVRDNGAGFNMAYAGKLFKPFQRLHDMKDFPGTGIGLALVQRIIHRHGGKVWAEAEENRGATLYFTLS